LNQTRKYSSLLGKLDDHRRFTMAVAELDVRRLRQLVKQSIAEGASITKIVSRIEESVSGVYQARGYNDDDLDISLLILRLGGRKLLYAMSQQISVPSLRTLRRHSAFTKLSPSLGPPRIDDIVHNINSVVLPRLTAADQSERFLFRSGISVQWDEISIEEVADWFPQSDMVGGLCREHSGTVNTVLSTFENAVSIANALYTGTVHYGKEASVIAVGSFGTQIRGVFPILVSPTCKSETSSESVQLLTTVFEAWNTTAAARFGPIWSFASDGDANRRALVYQLFMKHTVDVDHVLYKYVGRLQGLNLQVGDGDITGDFDWKHLLKRIGRLLRTLEGVTVGRTIINFESIQRHLRRNPRLSEHDVRRLTNPSDSQDVPRAIEFIDAIHDLAALPTDDCSPAELQELPIIAVVAEMFTSFLDAFVTPDWSLSQQVASLSKFAHTAFALFQTHGVNFMPNQLYGDMQTTIKNAIFCIAKQLHLDRTQPFYLFWTGDDRLEGLFGCARMQGGHNPNFTYKDFVDRVGAGVDIAAVFARHPRLNNGFRRLKVTRTEHMDHLNPESWRGRVIVSEVDLESSWAQGRKDATILLRRIHVTCDFGSVFTSNPVLDMLRPFGNGSYPGVSTDSPDRS
ncbi:hypothetical protein BC629DRAFT_1243540, partial [Irpex lacteus]